MRYIVFIFLMVSVCSCKQDIPARTLKKIDISIDIQRFEQELFLMNPDTIASAISFFYDKYGDFYDIFGYYVIGIGSPTERKYPELLELFISDDINKQVYEEVNRVFPDLDQIETDFDNAFRRYSYFFPEDTIPEIVSFIGGFNYPGFTVENYLGIGLDMYLGSDCPFYTNLGLALYQVQNMNKDRIPLDALYNWINGKVDFDDSSDNVLARMIHEGKVYFLLEKLFPEYPPEKLFGFTSSGMTWVLKNEERMWVYLIENKLLYSNVLMDIQKLTGPAPYTSFFTSESPGRAIVYNGFKIVSEFARRNQNLSLKEIMKNNDYQSILRDSRYNPKVK